jgi:hypothetical protein
VYPDGVLKMVGAFGEGKTEEERFTFERALYAGNPKAQALLDALRQPERVVDAPEDWLVRSMALIGQQEPMIVTRMPADVYGVVRTVIVDGRQRNAALALANKMRAKENLGPPISITAVLRRYDDSRLCLLARVATNSHTAMSPMARARDMADLNAVGVSICDIATHCNLTVQAVKDALALLDLAPGAQQAVASRKITASAGKDIARSGAAPAEQERRARTIAGGKIKGKRASAVARTGAAPEDAPRMQRRDFVEAVAKSLAEADVEEAPLALAMTGWFLGTKGALDAFGAIKRLADEAVAARVRRRGTEPLPAEEIAALKAFMAAQPSAAKAAGALGVKVAAMKSAAAGKPVLGVTIKTIREALAKLGSEPAKAA